MTPLPLAVELAREIANTNPMRFVGAAIGAEQPTEIIALIDARVRPLWELLTEVRAFFEECDSGFNRQDELADKIEAALKAAASPA